MPRSESRRIGWMKSCINSSKQNKRQFYVPHEQDIRLKNIYILGFLKAVMFEGCMKSYDKVTEGINAEKCPAEEFGKVVVVHGERRGFDR